MKNVLLSTAAIAMLSLSANAQRMTLHEEFTGENCGPCATTNPGFWALCNGASNPSKLIHISYMVPIPSSGFYCERTHDIYTSRDAYYSVPFAPYGRYDGAVPDTTATNPGHPGSFTQADIDAEAARPDSFTITATSAWNATYDQIITTVNVTCATAWAASGSTVKLRAALIQTNDFASSPGSNGEVHFENVVQAMYPDVNGTAMATTWAAGATQTYTITGTVPSYVDKTLAPYMVVWIQDDNNKSIAQAAKGNALPSIAVDAAAVAANGPSGLICTTGTYSAAHTVSLKNTGTSTLTSASIYYSVDGGAYTSYAWTGSLAASSSVSVTMPAVSMTVGADKYHTIIDSVGMANGSADINSANNVAGTAFFIENTTGQAVPYHTSFESVDTNYYSTDINNNGDGWGGYQSGTTTPLGHTGTVAYGNILANDDAADINTLVMPKVNITAPATTVVSFWVAYSQLASGATDKLEVVYSADCGATWTSVWNKTGSEMTVFATSNTTLEVPGTGNYTQYTASLSSVPAGIQMLGFRATPNGGNTLFIDDINVHSSTAVNNVITASSLGAAIYPNPAKDNATLSFSLESASDIQVQIVDNLGRTLNTVANENMTAGLHVVDINTADLATGIYNIMIHTENGTFTQRLSVVK